MKYSLNPKEILRAKHKGFSKGSGYISPISQLELQYGHSQLQFQLILCIALAAGAIFSCIIPAFIVFH